MSILNENYVGVVVTHKLMGEVIVVECPPVKKVGDTVYEPDWKIRKPDGSIHMVKKQELELEMSKADILRKLAKATIQLANIALKEAEVLDAKTTTRPETES